jgi:O-methyltransferase domain
MVSSSISKLGNIRRAMSAGGKLLLLEMVMPGRAAPHIGMMIDVEMLVTLGDRERTRAEYADLLARASFRLTRVIHTANPMSISEAVPT